MRFDTPDKLEAVVWNSRIAELPRAENRAIINRLFNGDPPFDPAKAEENNVEVNRNFLEGTRILTDARIQWNSNFLKPGDQVNVHPQFGPVHKREEWGHAVTKSVNRQLNLSRRRMSEIRSTGANTLLHGVGPVNWVDRFDPMPVPLSLSSLLIASETDIDFENLEWFAVFREMTPSQLWERTHGTRVDPGWDMQMVNGQLKYVIEQDQKSISSTTLQYMPERIEEVIKQDKGYFGTDAVPTVDAWDVYFRDTDGPPGWYRRMILDWGVGDEHLSTYSKDSKPPDKAKNDGSNKGHFLYSSGKRRYAADWSEILHCQFGDCSCVAPFKYHSVRSLGWMIWGLCDIQNRLRCKMTEQAFSDLMWWFRVANNNDLNRIRMANFLHMGVIPQGVDFLKAADRYSPDPRYIELVSSQNRELMSENASSFTRDSGEGRGKEMTATEVMARTNSVNTLVSGVMNLAYAYENQKLTEIIRRLFLKNPRHPAARAVRQDAMKAGVPLDHLTTEAWDIQVDRAMGNGNKTVEMAIVNYLNTIRKNLGPDAQRKVDHIGIEIVTDQADLAEDLAPIKAEQQVSPSAHDAELATDRIMRGLPFTAPKFAVPEDYVQVWLKDFALSVQKVQQRDHMGTPDELQGMGNMEQHIKAFLDQMRANPDDGPKVRQYEGMLTQLTNIVKGFAQRLGQAMKAAQSQGAVGNGNNKMAETISKIQADKITASAKAQNMRESHADRTAQKQVSFELEQQRKDRQAAAEIRRKNLQHRQDLQQAQNQHVQDIASERAGVAQELLHNRLRSVQENGEE
jgi:hypothetical protein